MKVNLLNVFPAFLALLCWPIMAAAQIETRSFESKVIVVPSAETGSSRTYTYKIYGPDKVEYILDGSREEVDRLAETIRTNPDEVVNFRGEVIEGPTRTFRFSDWKKSTTTSTSTDEHGNTVVRREETTTR